MNRVRFFTACSAVALCGGVVSAQLTNVALNKPVTLSSGSNSGAALNSLTDGVFLPDDTQWQTDTVWWNDFDTSFIIDLQSSYALVGAIVQADDNDSYLLEYWNGSAWSVLWNVLNFDQYGSGMQTRPNPADNAEVFFFASPITTDRLRYSADAGDSSYSASEIQVFIPTPAAGATAMLAGLALVARRRR